MIKVRIMPSPLEFDPEVMELACRRGVTKQVIVELSIDGHELPLGAAFKMSDGRIVFVFEPAASDHPLWEHAVPIIERKVKRYLGRRDGKE